MEGLDQATVGAKGSTVTVSCAVVVALVLCPFVSVAAKVREKSASFVGVIVRLDRFQLWTSTEVCPVVAVKLCVPSLSFAPTGITLTTNDDRLLLSPGRFLTVTPRFSKIAEPSVPETLAGASAGASGVTLIVFVALAVLVLPAASVSLAVAVKLIPASLGGVISSEDSFQPNTLTCWPTLVMVTLSPWRSLRIAPIGAPEIIRDERVVAVPVAEADNFAREIGEPSTPVP